MYEYGETPWSNIRLLHDYFDFFQRVFIAILHYLAVVWQRGVSRPAETPYTIQVRPFRILAHMLSICLNQGHTVFFWRCCGGITTYAS